MILLETKTLTRVYGGVVAVSNVSFQAQEGLITGLIGPNGAGKTTLFNNMTGLDIPSAGKVYFKGKDITSLSAHKICRMGIARTFQNIRLFKELTVAENVMVGRHFKTGRDAHHGRTLTALGSYLHMNKEHQQVRMEAMRWLEFFGLQKFADELAKNLPYGHQRAFPRPVGADEAHDITLVHMHAYPSECLDASIGDADRINSQQLAHSSSFPRYASITSGFPRISLGVPLAMFSP